MIGPGNAESVKWLPDMYATLAQWFLYINIIKRDIG
jgi:hypothetical protein